MEVIETTTETRYNERVFRLVSYTLVVLMMTCAALTFSTLIHHVFPEWNRAVIASLAAFVAFERLLTYAQARQLTVLSRQWAVWFATQWIILLCVARFTISLAHGLPAFQADLGLLVTDSGRFWLAPEFILAAIICVLVWYLTGYAAELLEMMGLDETRIRREVVTMDARYVPPRARLMSLIFTLGTLLIAFTGLVRVDIREIFRMSTGVTNLNLGALANGGASTLLYFMFGLALLSQTQFISLHTGWRLQEVRVGRDLAHRWGPYSLVFLLILAAAVSLLPTHYGLGMLSSLGYLLDVVARTVFFVAQLLLSLLILIISLPSMLLGGDAPQTELPPPPTLPELPPVDTGATDPFPWLTLLRSILSWLLLLGILGYSLTQFLRQHRGAAAALAKVPLISWLISFWDGLRRFFGGAGRRMAESLGAGIARMRSRRTRPGTTRGSSFLRLGRLDPRQRIHYFYLALVRRAGERGLARPSSQTPYEYAAHLQAALPQVESEIGSLTDAFVEARYGSRPMAAAAAARAQILWGRIRNALRLLLARR